MSVAELCLLNCSLLTGFCSYTWWVASGFPWHSSYSFVKVFFVPTEPKDIFLSIEGTWSAGDLFNGNLTCC